MMKKLFVLCFVLGSLISTHAQTYHPSAKNLAARHQFQNNKFGMFIHWGLSSTYGAGEWIMNNANIKKADYTEQLHSFNPVDFDASKWVAAAKTAGMKYIVFITRHHDGFSNWDTKFSDWKITNTTYCKDVLKMLAQECKKQGIRLGLYYSLLDWYRDDYPYETGRTGKGTGRTAKSDYASYLQFMKNQLTELLTNYGDIMSIWLDGHWDQTNQEGSADMSSRIDWKYPELYSLIHRLQPQCLIGNNHHLAPFPGEDFQMFERELPGENISRLNFQPASGELPLETCETMNGSWGFNSSDNSHKTVKQTIHYLIKAAGRNANFLLNIGPKPDGTIQQEFTDTLAAVGRWMQQYGETIYGTRSNMVKPQDWGVVTNKGKLLYVHLLNAANRKDIFLPGVKAKIKTARLFDGKKPVRFTQQAEGITLYPDGIDVTAVDTIIELQLQ
jgi:alpha-L-fucosidase